MIFVGPGLDDDLRAGGLDDAVIGLAANYSILTLTGLSVGRVCFSLTAMVQSLREQIVTAL